MKSKALGLRSGLLLGTACQFAVSLAAAQEAEPEVTEAADAATPEDASATEDNPSDVDAGVRSEASLEEEFGLEAETEAETETEAEAEAEAETDEVEVDSGGGLFESSQSGADDDGGATSSSGFDWNGYVRSDFYVGASESGKEAAMQAAYGELALSVTARKEDLGDAFAEFRMRAGKQGEQDLLHLDLREAYVNGYFGPLELRLGKQIVAWGRADVFNPTSNITPVDFRVRSPQEDDRRVGNIGARAFLNFEPFRLEGVWMPLYESTKYPPLDMEEVVTVTPPNFPEPTWDNGLGAGRLHLLLPSFETSVSYLFGYALLPGVVFDGYDVGVDAEVRVTQTPYKHHVIGFDFSTAFGELFALRGEAAYRKPVNPEASYAMPKPDLQYVIGVDRAFGNVSVIAQYIGRYTFNWELLTAPAQDPDVLYGVDPDLVDPTSPNYNAFLDGSLTNGLMDLVTERNQVIFSQRAQVQHSISARIEWLTLHETLSISALGLLNVTTQEWALFPKIGYQITDGMSAYLGAEIYSGPEGNLFNYIESSLTAGYTELRLSF